MTAISTSLFAQSTDEQAIKTVVSTMESGWTQKSGEKYSSVFADVHDYIVWNGYYFPNMSKQQNAAAHQELFNGVYRTFDIRLKVDKIRYLRPDLALVHVLGGGYTKGEAVPEHPGVLMSMVMEKKDNNWKVLSFHNLDLLAFADKQVAERSPMPLKVMYANWYKN